MAPLQKRALVSLLIGLGLTLAFAVVLISQADLANFDTSLPGRLVMYAALIGVPLVYLILVDLTLRKPTQVDERDRVIVDRSGRIQSLAVILIVVAWTIVLTEKYRAQRQVPVEFLNLMMVSVLIASVLAQALGILIGYRRMNRNG
jgi:hypothetical protein